MATYNVTGTVSNGAVAVPFTGTITAVAPPVVNSVVVVPDPAAAGTLRTITINASDPQSLPLTYTLQVAGATATVTAQPNVFTVTV